MAKTQQIQDPLLEIYNRTGLGDKNVTYDQFSAKFQSDGNFRRDVYGRTGLSSKGVDFDKFQEKLLKKKEQSIASLQDSGSGAPISGEPLPPSRVPDNTAADTVVEEPIVDVAPEPETSPEVNFGLQQQPQTGLGTSITGQGITQQQLLTGTQADFVGAQSRRLGELISSYQQANPDAEVPVRTLEEIESSRGVIKEAIPESWGKRNKERAQYVYNNLLAGVGSIANEAIDLGLQFQAATQPAGMGAITDINLTNYRANVAPSVRNALVEVIGADMSDETRQRYQSELFAGAVGGLAASAPAMIGSKLRMTRFFLQGADAALQSIEQADVNNELSNLEKTAYSSVVGLANAYLEKIGFDKIFGGNTGRIAQYVANRTINDAVKGGKKISGDALTTFLNKNLSEVSSAYARGGARAVEGFIVEGLTGASQEAVNIGSEYAVNALAGKQLFDTEESAWDGFTSSLGRVGQAGLMEAIGGGILGGGAGLMSSSSRSKVYDQVKRISEIDAQLSNPEIPESTKEGLLQIKINLAKGLEQELKVNYDEFQKLTEDAKSKIQGLNEQAVSAQEVIDDPNVSDEVKDTAEQQLKEIDSGIDETVEGAKISAERQSEIDDAISAFQKQNPGVVVDPLEDLSDSVVTTFERVEDGLPVDPTAVEEASDWLYNKYKELSAMKRDKNRRLTIPQIESMQAQLEADIITLENYITEQRNAAETEPVFAERQEEQIQPEATVDESTTSERQPEQFTEVVSEEAEADIERIRQEEIDATAKALEGVELPSNFVAQDKGGILNRENYYRLAQEKFQESEGLTNEEIFDKNKQRDEFKTQKGRDAFQKRFEQFAENPKTKKQILAEAYHKAKADGSNPELVEAVEELIGNNNQSSLNTPTEAQTSTPVIKTEAEAQTGQYFTRDIGGEQTVYRRNEDGTASIVPEAEVQTILSQQTEGGQDAVQEPSTKKIPVRKPSGDSAQVEQRVPESGKSSGEVQQEGPGAKEVEGSKQTTEITESSIPTEIGQTVELPVSEGVTSRVTASEAPDGSTMYTVEMYRDGEIMEDKNGDTSIEFTETEDAVKYINSKQRGYGLSAKKKPTPKKAPTNAKSGKLETPVHLDLAGHNIGWKQLPSGKYTAVETNTDTNIGREFDSLPELQDYWEKNKTSITGVGMTQAIEAGKSGTTIMATTSRKSGRIEPLRREPPKGTPKKLSQMLSDLANSLGATIIYAKPKSRGARATYDSTNTLISMRNAGDLDAAAHEIGHWVDDTTDFLGGMPKSAKDELKWFYQRGGSNPPTTLSPAQRLEYRQREGVAEFIRAYVVNKSAAKQQAPELYDYFIKQVPPEMRQSIDAFSKDVLDFYNAPEGDQMQSNVDMTAGLKDKQGFKDWLKSWSKSKDNLRFTPWDYLNNILFNSLSKAEKAYDFAAKIRGLSPILKTRRLDFYSRNFSGINGKIEFAFDQGIPKFNATKSDPVMLGSDGEPMTMDWLYNPLAKLMPTKETMAEAETDSVNLLLAERTIEYANKFGRRDNLTGFGGGLRSDFDVAQGFLDSFAAKAKADPAYGAAVREVAKRYREMADAGLTYARDGGLISQELYQTIKDGNRYYANMKRVKESQPGEELVSFLYSNSKRNFGSIKQPIGKAKGGTESIGNPFVNMFDSLVNLIVETDRNKVMQEFVEPLRSNRTMGSGRVQQLAQIGRPVKKGEPNTIKVFNKGKEEYWQFNKDVYSDLKSLESIPQHWVLNMLRPAANIIRFTVTHDPAFAGRNFVRDTSERLIKSRVNSTFFDLINEDGGENLLKLFGGSQAGHYLTSRKAYYDMMKDSMYRITKKGGIVINPLKIGKKGWKAYEKVLQKAESANRVAEFNSAYRQALNEGLSEHEAGLYAAFQARDLMDFAVAGHWIRVINQVFPFTNAHVQSLRRSAVALKENPIPFLYKMAMYTYIPTILTRMINASNDDEEEYRQLPRWQRDLYWNFKIKALSDKFISIPKPHELSLTASYADRLYDYTQGDERAFEGIMESTFEAFGPFDTGTVAGPFKPFVEVATNYNFLTGQPIVPRYEENLKLSLRKGAQYSSSAGQWFSQAFGVVGLDGKHTDPRMIDHVVRGYLTNLGDKGMRLSNLITGNDKSRTFNVAEMTSFVKERPIAGARDVRAVYDKALELGLSNKPAVRTLRALVRQFYAAETIKQRDELSKKIIDYAGKVRVNIEELEKKQQ